MTNVHIKLCSKCDQSKEPQYFYIDKSKKDGLSSFCKPCRKSSSKEYALKNIDFIKEKDRQEYIRNRDVILARNKITYEKNKDQYRKTAQQTYLRNREIKKHTETGIYQILNIKTGKFYIGSSSFSMFTRWAHHKTALKHNKHHSAYLQNSWNKYGEENFEFVVIERCSAEKCLEREQFYMDLLNPAYNMAKKSNNCLGVKHSEATKKKMSEAHKGHKRNLGKFWSPERRLNRIEPIFKAIPVKATSKDGLVTIIFENLLQAEQSGFDRRDIIRSIRGRTPYMYGFHWSFECR